MINRFYKIGEVSKMLDLPTSTIRYWENQFRQLRPVKSTGGQRFYTNQHIYLLEQLKDMLHNERYTIEGAKNRLKEIIAGKEKQSQDKPYNIESIKQELRDILLLLE